jgi:hypothetical protein
MTCPVVASATPAPHALPTRTPTWPNFGSLPNSLSPFRGRKCRPESARRTPQSMPGITFRGTAVWSIACVDGARFPPRKHRPEVYARWVAMTPPGWCCAVKMPRKSRMTAA